jgi:hypothetical protein
MSYTKYHDPWTSLHEPTAKAWNHLESQWDAIKADADAHSHDARYYTKASADATFFALTTSVTLGMDADKLDGQHFSDILAAVMPIGAIMIWSGSDANVPSGWHICDGGTYGGIASPNLRDRFVIGAGGSYSPGATVGPATYNGTITPTGTVAVGNHTLTTSELPAHTHTYTEYFNGTTIVKTVASTPGELAGRDTSILNQNEGGGSPHGHTGSTISFTAIDPRPAYHSLYYIMKYA